MVPRPAGRKIGGFSIRAVVGNQPRPQSAQNGWKEKSAGFVVGPVEPTPIKTKRVIFATKPTVSGDFLRCAAELARVPVGPNSCEFGCIGGRAGVFATGFGKRGRFNPSADSERGHRGRRASISAVRIESGLFTPA